MMEDFQHMNELQRQNLKRKFLEKYVFYDLQNLNDGFDSHFIYYFTESEFKIVLNRIQDMGLGIYGLEPWKGGEFFWVETYEEVTTDPKDSNWYFESFERFKNMDNNLQFSATYQVPDHVLLKFSLGV
jgi:hypothetical protein